MRKEKWKKKRRGKRCKIYDVVEIIRREKARKRKRERVKACSEHKDEEG